MEFDNLHQILRSLYEQMMPLCADMAGVAKGIAGLGALFYVAYRVWQSLARAEPIDVFPMLRPFAVGLCIMFFPTVVLGTINSVLSPVVQGTAKLLETQTLDMNKYREQKDRLEYEAMVRNPETAYLVSNEEFDKQLEELGWSPSDMVTMAGMYIDRGMYKMKKGIRDFFREILELMFQAAALVIDTIRTFFLVVLAILGPIAFAISVWDGFQSTLTQWICRYIQVYLWLPVSDIFSTILAKIQVLMLQSDIERMQADPNFSLDSSDGVYIVFMIIGIIGYGFRDDIHRSLNRFCCRLYFLFFRKITFRFGLQWLLGHLKQDNISKSFQSFFFCNRRTSTAFWTIWTIQIIHDNLCLCRKDLGFQFVSQFALLFDACENLLFLFFQITQVHQSFMQCPQLCIVQCSCNFFSISCDKRNRIAFIN